jgi:glycosyltransferase involved in cell wall biosynthesis
MKILMMSTIGMGPPHHGNRARFRTLADALSKHADVSILGLNMPAEEFATLPSERYTVLGNLRDGLPFRIRRKLGRIIRKAFSGTRREANEPLDRDLDRGLITQIARITADTHFDLAVVNYATYSLYLTALPGRTRTAIDTIDVLSNRRARFASIGGGEAWQSMTPDDERRALLRADTVIAIQEKEAVVFRELLPRAHDVQVISYLDRPTEIPRDASAFSFGILSSDNPINIQSVNWFIDAVWLPFIERVPTARLLIGGGVCAHIPDHSAVTKLGVLPAVEAFYRQVDICINPCLTGTGLKIKTVEALAAGRCVVGSRYSADGLTACEENGLFEANAVNEYLDLMARLLGDPAFTRRSGTAGHQYLRAMYETSMQAIAHLCQNARAPQ